MRGDVLDVRDPHDLAVVATYRGRTNTDRPATDGLLAAVDRRT